jgi:hypothetical protein
MAWTLSEIDGIGITVLASEKLSKAAGSDWKILTAVVLRMASRTAGMG